MHTNLKTVILSGTVALLSLSATAQAVGEGELRQMSQALNLTDSQKEKLRPILMNEAQQITRVRNDPTLSPKQKAEKELEVRQSFETRIDAELSSPQLRKVRNLRQQEEQQIRERINSSNNQSPQK